MLLYFGGEVFHIYFETRYIFSRTSIFLTLRPFLSKKLRPPLLVAVTILTKKVSKKGLVVHWKHMAVEIVKLSVVKSCFCV